MMKLFILILLPFTVFSQNQIETEIDSALVYAKKGLYWALSNYNPEKSRSDKELISGNMLMAAVKLTREYEGVKIESRGFYNSTEVFLKVYRSDEYLKENGYLIEKDIQEETKKKKKKL